MLRINMVFFEPSPRGHPLTTPASSFHSADDHCLGRAPMAQAFCIILCSEEYWSNWWKSRNVRSIWVLATTTFGRKKCIENRKQKPCPAVQYFSISLSTPCALTLKNQARTQPSRDTVDNIKNQKTLTWTKCL